MSLNQRIKSAFGHGLLASGLHHAALRQRGVIVAFHRVNDSIPEDGLTVSSSRFAEFCDLFKQHYDVISLHEFVNRLKKNSSVAGTLVITFDDGYLDNSEVAAPILRSLGLPATFFVTTRFLGTNIVPWWDNNLPRQPGWMTWDHVQALSRDGFDIGGHTRTHVNLGEVDGDLADSEIRGSRADLMERLGVPVRHFAYPYGGRANLLDANRARIIDAGFDCCLSSCAGLTPPDANPFHLDRIAISPWFETPEQFVYEAAAVGTLGGESAPPISSPVS
jgi:peptidoglycan/xylan/chitin deacetylase (PgdA/CDA1 family)